MKSRHWLALFVGLGILALVWFLKHGKPESISRPSASETTQFPSAKNTPVGFDTPSQRQVNANSATNSAVRPPEPESAATSEEKCRAIVEGKNIPVEFWGQVVGADNAPLDGVTIKYDIRHWDYVPNQGATERNVGNTVTTDLDGRFHITGAAGDDLALNIQKEGYELEPRAKVGYGFGTADQPSSTPDAPVIFKMWRANVREKLITGEKSLQFIPDGRSYVIDFAKATVAESGPGDLQFQVKRPEKVEPDQKYDWSAEIAAINGGLLEETNGESSMYLAPEGNYSSRIEFTQQPTGRQRASTGTRRFYVKLDNGQEYGRVTIELIAPYSDRVPGMLHLEYAINPAHSRVLR